MAFLISTYDHSSIAFPSMATDHGIVKQLWCIVIESCFVMGYTDDARYLTGEAAPTDLKQLFQRRKNVLLMQRNHQWLAMISQNFKLSQWLQRSKLS